MKLPITITKKNAKTFTIEFDANRWERVAAALGLFSDECTKSLERAEQDIAAGRIQKLTSFDDLDT